jgi:hypothetical protein
MWEALARQAGQKNATKARRLQSVSLAMLMTAQLPPVWFVLIVGVFTYMYHTTPALPWFFALLGLDVVLVSAWPVTVPARHWTRWEWLPMFAGLGAITLGVLLGIPNNTMMEPWVHVNQLRRHSDVPPGRDPRLAADAGILQFAEGAALDVDASAGFRAWPHTYCAAPVVDNSTGDGDPVGFFAVGLNCCDRRGGFTCDGAEDPDVRTAVRMSPHGLSSFWTGQNAGANFRRAALMAAAANGKEVKEPVVLVIWTQDPESLATTAWWTATGLFLGCILVAALWCSLGTLKLWEDNQDTIHI